jgi:hypothetical protein
MVLIDSGTVKDSRHECQRTPEGILIVNVIHSRPAEPTPTQSISYTLLHLSDVELDVRFQLHVLVVGAVHFMLDILLQISHL